MNQKRSPPLRSKSSRWPEFSWLFSFPPPLNLPLACVLSSLFSSSPSSALFHPQQPPLALCQWHHPRTKPSSFSCSSYSPSIYPPRGLSNGLTPPTNFRSPCLCQPHAHATRRWCQRSRRARRGTGPSSSPCFPEERRRLLVQAMESMAARIRWKEDSTWSSSPVSACSIYTYAHTNHSTRILGYVKVFVKHVNTKAKEKDSYLSGSISILTGSFIMWYVHFSFIFDSWMNLSCRVVNFYISFVHCTSYIYVVTIVGGNRIIDVGTKRSRIEHWEKVKFDIVKHEQFGTNQPRGGPFREGSERIDVTYMGN